MKEAMLEALREYCELVYAQLKGNHPTFMVSYWADLLIEARANPTAPESMDLLMREEEYQAARAALANFYQSSVVAISEAEDAVLLPTVQGVMQGAGQLIYGMTEGDEASRVVLLAELQELAEALPTPDTES